jgi:predicted RecA/RadA family phage recombinase
MTSPASFKLLSGETVSWTNGTGSAVTVGDLVRVGSYINGRATVDIASTATGTVEIEGIVKVTSDTGYAAAQGAPAYYDVATKSVNSDTANVLCGVYAKAKATADVEAEVLLLPTNLIFPTSVNDTVASGGATKAVAFTGAVAATGKYAAFLQEATTNAVYVRSAIATDTDEVTVTLSGDPGASNADVTVIRLA